MIKKFVMLQQICISDQCRSFYSSKEPEINLPSCFQHNKYAANQNIIIISKESCDWSNDVNFLLLFYNIFK